MKNPNICRYIMFILIIIGLLIAGISGVIWGIEPVSPLFVAGALISIGALIFGIISVRCPSCHRQLHLKGIQPDEYCPHCGEKIE
ncbi:MAG: hypothetical protein PUG60_15000 [Lachnospiraceae bacterium]|nr:hypothetical protein [Lachnospiraceae bacterium]MDY4969213.1 hypothetical protein [Lachnospiraceae bacterium]